MYYLIKYKYIKLLFCFLFWLIVPFVAFSQEKATFSYTCENKILSEVLNDFEKKVAIRFSYSDELVKEKKITLNFKNATLKEALNIVSSKLKLHFKKINNRYYFIKKSRLNLDKLQHLEDVLLPNYLTNGIYKNKNATFQIIPKKFDLLAGLTETDILESIQQLPGVVSPNETATGLLVRGGSADQNRVIWDGINIYHNGHLFGMISAFNPNITKKITFYNKGTNPKFGERISSVIDIQSNNAIPQKMAVGLGVNGLNADFFLEIPLVKDKLSIQTSFRRSFTEFYESLSFDKLADKVFQNTKINSAKNSANDFFFSDFNLKLNFKLNKKNDFHFSYINIENNLDFLVKETADSIQSPKNFNDKLTIKNEGYSFSLNRKWNTNVSQHIIANLSKYRLNYNFITKQEKEQLFDFEKRNVIFDSGILSEINIKTNNKDLLMLGYQYALKDVSYAFIRTDDLIFNLDNDQTISKVHSFFSNYSYHNSKLVDFEAGVRLNYFSEFEKLKFEPRILIYKNIFDKIKIQLTGEIKNQVISQIDETILSDLSLENKLWRLANEETFPIINSNQISAGVIYKNAGWSLDLDFYKKNIKGMTALSLGFLNPEGSKFYIGKQKILGADFYLKKDFNKIRMWLNYSYSDIKNIFDGLNNDKYFTAGNEISHAFTSSIAYKVKKFQVALAWKWRTGKPFTKALHDELTNEISFIEINTERLNNYHRMDLSSTYQFYFSKNNGVKGKVGFSIRNLYNQKNQLSREYSGNNSINDPIQVVDKFSLGFTPNILFRVYW